MNKTVFFIALLGFGASALTQAETAHQHGVGVLNIAASQHDLMLELQTPADNILGFEHSPKTDQQKQKLTSSLHLLKQADSLFYFSTQARCRLQKVETENPFAPQETDKKTHKEHDSLDKEDDHKDGHKHETVDAHDHKNEHEHETKDEHEHETIDSHTDFTANYAYRCEQPKQLESINLAGLFKSFPNFEILKAQWVHGSGQSAKTVSKEDVVINFSNK